MSGSYDDIINLPHHTSSTHQRMPRENRAAQFAPFAALTGYDTAISETARLTDAQKVLDDSAIADLGIKLSLLSERLDECQEVAIIYFQPDAKKDGGAYITVMGALKKIDEYERTLVFMDGKTVAFDDVLEIESELFDALL